MSTRHSGAALAVLLAVAGTIGASACGPPDDLTREKRRARVEEAARRIAEESCERGNRIGCPDSARPDVPPEPREPASDSVESSTDTADDPAADTARDGA